MKKEAWELTGFKKNEEFIIYSTFARFRREHPNITLDGAILLFENVSKEITLECFAIKKQRTAESYRKVYKKYFIDKI